jgi:signal transduction histidine kinase
MVWVAVRLRRGWVAERHRRAQENISRQLLVSQEADRKRIAAELHDSLGQNLLIIKNRLHLAQQAMAGSPPAEQLREISRTVTQTIAEVREISYNLRPYQLDRLGLTKAVQSVVNRISDSGFLQIESHLANIDRLFSPENEINFYRIVQESLNNVIKHSDAARAEISIRRENGALAMSITDDGKGFDFRQATGAGDQPRGFGLTGLGERIRILGGTFACDSGPGRGTRLTFHIPIPANHEK